MVAVEGLPCSLPTMVLSINCATLVRSRMLCIEDLPNSARLQRTWLIRACHPTSSRTAQLLVCTSIAVGCNLPLLLYCVLTPQFGLLLEPRERSHKEKQGGLTVYTPGSSAFESIVRLQCLLRLAKYSASVRMFKHSQRTKLTDRHLEAFCSEIAGFLDIAGWALPAY